LYIYLLLRNSSRGTICRDRNASTVSPCIDFRLIIYYVEHIVLQDRYRYTGSYFRYYMDPGAKTKSWTHFDDRYHTIKYCIVYHRSFVHSSKNPFSPSCFIETCSLLSDSLAPSSQWVSGHSFLPFPRRIHSTPFRPKESEHFLDYT
jgi:hypothetical protein